MSENSLGDRLKAAIRRAGMSQTEAQQLIQNGLEKGKGGSSANFYRVLSGAVSPSVDFLREASKRLEVSADWLLTGQGEIEREDPVGWDLVDDCGLEGLPEQIQHDVIRLALQLLTARERSELDLEETDEQIVALARGIAAWIQLPLRSEKLKDLQSDLEVTAYCDAALRALRMLRPVGEGASTPAGRDEVLDRLAQLDEELARGD